MCLQVSVPARFSCLEDSISLHLMLSDVLEADNVVHTHNNDVGWRGN